jgi:peptidoglycan/xylan/chitin deacetylase (PgdA/CDA1 family)
MDFLRLTKLAISGVYFAVTRLSGTSKRDQSMIVFYYHAVRAHEVERFRNQVRAMVSYGDIVKADDISAPNGRPKTSVTFDDAFQCVFDNALPVLAEFNVPCTIFVPTAKMGRVADWEMEAYCADKSEVLASEDTIRSTHSSLVNYGAHSDTHPRLSQVDPERAKNEIFGPKAKLEELLNTKVELFAFPYGDYDERVLRLTTEARYKFVYSIGPGAVTCGDTQLLRARVPVDPSDHAIEFWLKLRGAYGWMPVASRLKRYVFSHLGRGGVQAT